MPGRPSGPGPLRQPGRRALVTGIVPRVNQSGLSSGHHELTKAGDPGLRQALYLAADLARRVDPTLADRYHRLVVAQGKHHVSALCSVAAGLVTRIAACWRNGQRYELKDIDGTVITEAEGRAICKERYTIDPAVRAARRRTTKAAQAKRGAGRRGKESTTQAAPATDPPVVELAEKVA